MNGELRGLPESWAQVELEKIGTWRGGGTPSKAIQSYWTGPIPWVSPKDMKVRLIRDAEDHISEAALADSATQLIPVNSVLIVTRSGILSHTLPVGLSTIPVTINQDLKAVTPFQGILPNYLFLALESSGGAILGTCSKTGTTVPSVEFDRLKQFPIPLAPLAEQKVIADKLDALLAQVDTLKARLDAIPAILKRFRQSILSAAVTGKLTEDWRSCHNLPASGLQLVGDLCSIITKGASPNWQGFEYVEDLSQTLFITSENVGTMRLILDKMKYVQNEFNDKQRRSVLRRGDVLTNIVGASIGRSAVWDREEIANINQAVCVLRPDAERILPEYLCFYLNSPIGIDDMVGHIVEVARANVSLASINSLQIVSPSIQEQTEIVRRVESLFAFADQIEARAQEATARVKHLTQSILAKAFRGELTEEWRKVNSELVCGQNSADALMERLHAAREATPEAKGKRRRNA